MAALVCRQKQLQLLLYRVVASPYAWQRQHRTWAAICWCWFWLDEPSDHAQHPFDYSRTFQTRPKSKPHQSLHSLELGYEWLSSWLAVWCGFRFLTHHCLPDQTHCLESAVVCPPVCPAVWSGLVLSCLGCWYCLLCLLAWFDYLWAICYITLFAMSLNQASCLADWLARNRYLMSDDVDGVNCWSIILWHKLIDCILHTYVLCLIKQNNCLFFTNKWES